MATRRRRTTITRRPAKSSLTERAVREAVSWIGEAVAEMTDDQRRDGAGLLLGGAAVAIVASMVFPSLEWLGWLRDKVLWLVGLGGWPILAGGMLVAAVLLIHPPFARGLQRIQGILASIAGLLVLGLFSLASRGLGGAVGNVLASGLTRGLGHRGAGFALVLSLAAVVVITRRAWLAAKIRAALRPRVAAAKALFGGRVRSARDGAEEAGSGGVGSTISPAVAADAAVAGEVAATIADEEPEVTDANEEVAPPVPAAPAPSNWRLPSIDLLAAPKLRTQRQEADVKRAVTRIEAKLATFKIAAKVVEVDHGPSLTRYVLEIADDVAVSEVEKRAKDLSLALAAGTLRIQAPIPGRSAIGLEVPNKTRETVALRSVIEAEGLAPATRSLALALGSDVSGQAVIGDLAKMPHLLVAGATGQGKSVCTNVLIGSLLLQHSPETLRMILVDPKRVELAGYAGLPHLAFPVIVDHLQAVRALQWAFGEMNARYKLLAHEGVRNIASFNERSAKRGEKPMPYVLFLIDELADLMMESKREAAAEKRGVSEVEELIVRLAQMARAVGIHLVLATQRPSVDVVTGLIKANVPSRIAFKVSSGTDSRVVLDSVGAEKLLGAGDMLYQPVDGEQIRLQGAYLSDAELEAIVEHWTRQGGPRHLGSLDADPATSANGHGLDPLFARAARLAASTGVASAAMLERDLNVGHARASRLADLLSEHGVAGAAQGNGRPREVLMDGSDVDELLERLGLEGGSEPARDVV